MRNNLIRTQRNRGHLSAKHPHLPIALWLYYCIGSLYKMKIKGAILFILLIGAMVGQNLQMKENYKAAVRIKLRLDDNPLLYMNEPKSAHLNIAYEESRGFIVFYETRQIHQLQSKMNGIDQAAKRYGQTQYDQTIPTPKKRPNIRYNYFSTGLSDRD